ncbi:MAG: type II toxin-antitoxin system VapC family toxin [Planctomycetes bacterium]|nr:type II toxin-antitoxin system VapC family toxin [Planctomycetota bacterium]
MRFWDTSALMAILIGEDHGRGLARLLEEDPKGVLWFLTSVEVRSGLARRARAGAISPEERGTIWERFTDLRTTFSEVSAPLEVREHAHRLLDSHALRAGDALQLGAAIVGAKGEPETLPFVTLDRRLAAAASKEGFPVLPPLTGEGIVAEKRPRAARGRQARTAMAAGR